MTSRQLALLSAAAMVIVLGAIWIGFADKPSVEQSVVLYPALKDQLAKVQAVQIYQPGDRLAIELARTASGWSLKQRNNYAADASKVNALLLSLESAKLREEKTGNPANYAVLGVQDLNISGASGARVELIGVEPPMKLIVGKSDDMAHASYVRRAGEVKSWLTSEQLTAPTGVAAWLHRDLLNINADRIQEASVQITDKPRYNIVKAQRADANFDVTPLPKGRELNSLSAGNAIAQTLVNLQLDDVRPIAELSGTKNSAETIFHTFDGLAIDVSGYTIDGKQWITAKASFDEALAKRFHPAAVVPANKKTPVATANSSGNSPDVIVTTGRAEAEARNRQLSSWAYTIASYKYDAIFKPVEQLLKKPAEPLPKKK